LIFENSYFALQQSRQDGHDGTPLRASIARVRRPGRSRRPRAAIWPPMRSVQSLNRRARGVTLSFHCSMESMMRVIVPVLGLAALLATAGCAEQTAATAPAADQAATHNSVCLQTVMIDHTSIPDDNTILFHMRDHKVWKNTLPFSCPGLKIEGGFEYETRIDEICSNLQTIRVLRERSVCMLGAFTPYEPPPKPPQ